MIFALLNQKGGVGKTTLSIHIADALARMGSRVMLIDADPQQSAMKWSTAGQPRFPVIGMAKPTLHKEISKLNADHIVIDGPPRLTDLARSVILAADITVIPVQPSPFDVWATAETVDIINDARVFKETIRAVIAVNRKIVNTAISRDVREALATLNLPVLESDVTQRVGFAEAMAAGLTVADLDPTGKAAQEIDALVSELMRMHDQESDHDRTARLQLAADSRQVG